MTTTTTTQMVNRPPNGSPLRASFCLEDTRQAVDVGGESGEHGEDMEARQEKKEVEGVEEAWSDKRTEK